MQINKIHLRQAVVTDIPAMHFIRNEVKENVLSDPSRVTPEDYDVYLLQKGKGWVSLQDGDINGFCIVNLADHNLWALFVHPAYQGRGVGKQLHDQMLAWYFTQTNETLWLSTESKTKAEAFYRKNGWMETGASNQKETRFEMTLTTWNEISGAR